MAFDCITNLFRDFIRPFRKRNRKQMDYGALDVSLVSLVSADEECNRRKNTNINYDQNQSKNKKTNKSPVNTHQNPHLKPNTDSEEMYIYSPNSSIISRKIKYCKDQNDSDYIQEKNEYEYSYTEDNDDTSTVILESCNRTNENEDSVEENDNDYSTVETLDTLTDFSSHKENCDSYHKNLMNTLEKNENSSGHNNEAYNILKYYSTRKSNAYNEINQIIKTKMLEYLSRKV